MNNKLIPIGLLVASVILSTGCSGIIPNFRPKGEVVSATYIAQFSGSGSLNTLWYQGSDADYHYFSHYAKISTRYRVRKAEIIIPEEFSHADGKSIFIGMSPVWRIIKKSRDPDQKEAQPIPDTTAAADNVRQ